MGGARGDGVRVPAGLTSRPVWSRGSAEPNPYSNAAQADLIQKLCSELNLQRVFLAGHADGALIALIAAAQAARCDPMVQEGRKNIKVEWREVCMGEGGDGKRAAASMRRQMSLSLTAITFASQRSHEMDVWGVGARHHETVSQSNDDAAAEAGSSSSRSDSFTGATQVCPALPCPSHLLMHAGLLVSAHVLVRKEGARLRTGCKEHWRSDSNDLMSAACQLRLRARLDTL